MSSAFAFASAEQAAQAFTGEKPAWIYGRWGNPTVRALEEKLTALEGAEDACATASGMAAIAGVVLSQCEAGDHVVAPRSMYAESARLLRERLPKLGITTTFVDGTIASYARAITSKTKLLYVETPANPTLGIVDIRAIAELKEGRSLVVDGTFATPFSQTPLTCGADLVVHSMTKGIGGHGDVIGGAVLGARTLVDKARDTIVKGFGGVLSPISAWLVLRGLRTFAIRQERACATAAALAKHLADHPAVAVVHHPSLASHPGHDVARRQMHAFGALLSFELKGADALARGKKVLESLKVATHAVSLGDVRTLVVHPASTTHSTMPEGTRIAGGITDGLIRVSVGLEGETDLKSDFSRALT
jgi:methionine-gamma-lyase